MVVRIRMVREGGPTNRIHHSPLEMKDCIQMDL